MRACCGTSWSWSRWKIIPAIDLHDGNCVRLLKGDFDQDTHYSDQPLDIARTYAGLNVADLHVVDLDGARTGAAQCPALFAVVAGTSLSVQLGGGIRKGERLRHWLDNGVPRCVVGSVAVTNRNVSRPGSTTFGADRIVLALDVTIDETACRCSPPTAGRNLAASACGR